ncbi:MAG: cupin domain-containing protein [Deltaproteobacteria bacterium]|nr:cupin domain-containing protein [Deltaproteobacteria bacterium]
MKIVEKPWGYEKIFAHTDRYVGKILHINRGELLSRQYHVEKDETVYVLSGRLFLETGSGDEIEEKILQPGESVRIPPGTIHRYCAPPDEDCELVEVSTPHLDDVVRLEDKYNR